ncbi:hypothetical protein MHB77_17920 [Paenibacillus sp. FSL K6-3166]|uniref:hypothetical protein n=1 Tax=unclassified Paenibacillus TaxID=185978 RepID=UPI0015C691A2|nr:hypothetical protein [Paenibacillus sp. VTT E-133291]
MSRPSRSADGVLCTRFFKVKLVMGGIQSEENIHTRAFITVFALDTITADP